MHKYVKIVLKKEKRANVTQNRFIIFNIVPFNPGACLIADPTFSKEYFFSQKQTLAACILLCPLFVYFFCLSNGF